MDVINQDYGSALVDNPNSVNGPPESGGFDLSKFKEALLGKKEEELIGSQPESSKSSFLDKYIKGPAEAALSAATSIGGAAAGAASGVAANLVSGKFGTPEGLKIADQRAKEVQDSLTYVPRSEAGKESLQNLGEAVDTSKIAGMGPTEAITLSGLPKGLRVPKAVSEVPSEKMPYAGVGSGAVAPQDMLRGALANSSPELQQILEQHIKKNPNVTQEALTRNLPVLERHAEADSLPVKINLTAGQATQDPMLISNEMNTRGAKEATVKRYAEQNKALKENIDAIKTAAAPDVYAASKPEHGEILIDAYKTKDAALNADISAKYKALNDANGGQFPLNGKSFVSSADEALHKDLLFDHVPPEIRKTMDRLRDGGNMTFENFESLRTNLARIQRSQADGNVKAAAGTIRNALEDLPMPPGAENLKPLADAARSAAKARFSLIEQDPAYKAVVTGKASADNFIDKHVLSSDLKNVKTMQANLAGDETAKQTIASGVMNHLKQRSTDASENFTQAGYNKALENIRPKLDVIFPPEQKQQLETLGRVARYTQAQPRGSFVNNSNTLVGHIAEAAKSSAEGATNVLFKGIPVGSWTRKLAEKYSETKSINEALQTGAGIRLKDIAK